MAKFTLDDFVKAAEEKYGNTEIDMGDGESVVLVNVLRLPSDKRKSLAALQEAVESEDADHAEIMREAIVLVAQSKTQAKRLLDRVGDDLSVLAEIFSAYTGATQLGEASPSQS